MYTGRGLTGGTWAPGALLYVRTAVKFPFFLTVVENGIIPSLFGLRDVKT